MIRCGLNVSLKEFSIDKFTRLAVFNFTRLKHFSPFAVVSTLQFCLKYNLDRLKSSLGVYSRDYSRKFPPPEQG